MSEIKNINLNLNTKQRFTVDGDANKVIELDTHDINVAKRLSESINMMDELRDKWNELTEKSAQVVEGKEITLETNDELTQLLDELETKMRGIVDFIFDSEGLCDIILGNSSIFTPVNGKTKYEQIIDGITGLYEDSIKAETEKLNKRKIANKTAKYVK